MAHHLSLWVLLSIVAAPAIGLWLERRFRPRSSSLSDAGGLPRLAEEYESFVVGDKEEADALAARLGLLRGRPHRATFTEYLGDPVWVVGPVQPRKE